MSFIRDFKEFAIRGNVVDLAVGIIVGAAFNKIVDTIVNGILLPPIGLVTGGLNYSDKKIILKHAVIGPSGQIIEPENALKYGELIEKTIIFIITAFAVFLLIRGINALRRKEHKKPEEPPKQEMSAEEKLLTEIRDMIKSGMIYQFKNTRENPFENSTRDHLKNNN